MAQSKYKKLLSKKIKKGMRGHPIATIAFYGPDNKKATKVVCSIFQHAEADPEPVKKWFTESNAMQSEEILKAVLSFLEESGVQSVGAFEQIIGCPHEEGKDYPIGEKCPQCAFWKNRDRFTHEILH